MSKLKVLGASGSKAKGYSTTSFQIDEDLVIDAGNIINYLGDKALNINHVFLTHSHSDHISDLPFLIETFFERRTEPLKIYALKDTIENIKKFIFNDKIWPDFTKIKLLNSHKYSLIYQAIELGQIIQINDYKIKAIYANHQDGACGYVVNKEQKSFLISGDTYLHPYLIEELNKNKTIKTLFIECSFPDRLKEFSKTTNHLSPCHIKEELNKLKRDDISVYFYHFKPFYEEELYEDIEKNNLFKYRGSVLKEGDVIHVEKGLIKSFLSDEDIIEKIMKINYQIASEHNSEKLFVNILTLLRKLTKADGGTLYIKSKDEKTLKFEIIQNEKLNIFLSASKNQINWPPLPIYLEDNTLNNTMVAVVSCNEKRIINIDDVYETKKYSFDGTKVFDKKNGYRSKSMLVIPLINHEDDVIGVVQLINKTNNSNIESFNDFDEKIIKSLSSQAAMAITNIQLIDSLEEFINAFVATIAKAIDTKSPHTKNHIKKVEKIASLIANAIHEDETIYKDIKYSKDDFKQISLAAWMHDIGKISTPEHVLDKGKKLEKIVDRIEIITERFEKIKKDAEVDYLKNITPKEEFENFIEKIDDYFTFIKKSNTGGEFMEDEDLQKLEKIQKTQYKSQNLLTEDEYYNLCVKRGSLTFEEIEIIRDHARLSYEMIKELPFPKKYKDVLNIAANHHEKLNGQGYPRGLSEKDIALEDRIMILSDIFEALTSSERPYKEAMKLSKVKSILDSMSKYNEIDSQLLEFFFNNKALNKYSQEDLKPFQIDLE